MKHQLFRKGTYVQVDVGKSHLTLVGKVKDSEITNQQIRSEGIFNIPQQSIQLENEVLVLYDNPESAPKLVDDVIFIADIINDLDGIAIIGNNIHAGIHDLSIPKVKLRELYKEMREDIRMKGYREKFKENQGAK